MPKKTKQPFQAAAACDILTADVAHKLGGAGATQTKIPDSGTDTNLTTFCVYRSQGSSISLAVRSAKNKQGAQLNQTVFASPPTASQTVRGYGDAAFWSPGFAQLNILQHGTWYILSDGVNNPSQRTLKQTEELANAIQNRL